MRRLGKTGGALLIVAIMFFATLTLTFTLPVFGIDEAPKKLTSPTPDTGDQFGFSVAGTSSRIVVGAPTDDTVAPNGGAVYLFDAITGNLVNTLTDPTPADTDVFGISVALVGNDVFVSAPNDGTVEPGAGIVYRFPTSSSIPSQTFLPPLGGGGRFGESIAASGGMMLIGAPQASAGGVPFAGKAYLYGANGALVQSFQSPTPTVDDNFGFSVGFLVGNVDTKVIVGANQADGFNGAAYIFDSTTGALVQTIPNPNPSLGSFFGETVSSFANQPLVGARGVAYRFDATGTLLVTYENPSGGPGTGAADEFGAALVRGHSGMAPTVLIGALGEDAGGEDAGAAYLFDAEGGTPVYNFLPASTPSPDGGFFGRSVAYAGTDYLVGAPNDSTGGSQAGAVYLFASEPFRPYGPHVSRVQLSVYADASQELAAFSAGQLDLPDSPVPPTLLPGYVANPDIRVSLPAGVNFERYAVLNAWEGTVTTKFSELAFGSGYSNLFSLLNMRPSGYVPANPDFIPGGGDPDLIRVGFEQGTSSLNPFHATTSYELRVLRMIYDTVLVRNPNNASQILNWMANTRSSVYFEASMVDQLTFRLRNDLTFHNGQPVTADDVVYSLLAYKELSTGVTASMVNNLEIAVVLDPRTVGVEVFGFPFAAVTMMAAVPIIPKNVWAPICGDPPSPSSPCADPAFEPMTGMLGSVSIAAPMVIGSGPFMCKNITTGTIGGSCTQDASGTMIGGQVSSGGRIRLETYVGYMRAHPLQTDSKLHVFSWADQDNDADVDIVDIANAAVKFGQPDSYWDSASNPQAPNVGCIAGVVDICEIATIAFYFDERLISPFTTATVTKLDACIDPFFMSTSTCP